MELRCDNGHAMQNRILRSMKVDSEPFVDIGCERRGSDRARFCSRDRAARGTPSSKDSQEESRQSEKFCTGIKSQESANSFEIRNETRILSGLLGSALYSHVTPTRQVFQCSWPRPPQVRLPQISNAAAGTVRRDLHGSSNQGLRADKECSSDT